MRAPADNLIGYLFTGGGWISIINSILIVFFSSAFAGIFEGAKLLVEVERGVTFLFHTVGGYVTNLIVSTTVSAAACNQTLAILLSAQIQNRLYTGEQARTILALRLENTVILISALIPWNIALSLPLFHPRRRTRQHPVHVVPLAHATYRRVELPKATDGLSPRTPAIQNFLNSNSYNIPLTLPFSR